MPSSDMAAFREVFKKSRKVIVLTGAGVSAESGVPTFRGSGGLWRNYRSQDLATPGAFSRSPSLVWEFYHYRRELVATKIPNPAHEAIAAAEAVLKNVGGSIHVITQNVDGLHQAAGSKGVLELHGSLFRTRCLSCGKEEDNRDSPICEALRDKGAPDATKTSDIPEAELPRCGSCSGLLRPAIVWFGEGLDENVLEKTYDLMASCDLCLVVGTSSVVYPAAQFAPQLAGRGVPVAEFNLEATPETGHFGFHFSGPCGELLPTAIAPY